MKAVYLDFESLDKNDLDFSGLHAVFDELVLYPGTLPEQVLERVQRAEVIISNKVVLNAETLQQCPQLKLILISATGTNNVDLQQAKQQGITVCNCQGYGTSAVAQHTLMLMLNLATSFRQYDRAVQQGEWNKASQFCLLDFPIIELSGKTLGLVGYGELGKEVAIEAQRLGVDVEFVIIEWGQKVNELNSKAIDVVWNGMTLTDEVKNSMECTNPYFNNAQVVVTAGK